MKKLSYLLLLLHVVTGCSKVKEFTEVQYTERGHIVIIEGDEGTYIGQLECDDGRYMSFTIENPALGRAAASCMEYDDYVEMVYTLGHHVWRINQL